MLRDEIRPRDEADTMCPPWFSIIGKNLDAPDHG
jgi:hypothetical protein